jgi:hypothetical protein
VQARRIAANIAKLPELFVQTLRSNQRPSRLISGFDALSQMGLLIGTAVVALVIGAGYAVRERKSRMRSRSYYHDD